MNGYITKMETSLSISPEIPEEDWRLLGRELGALYLSSRWWLGDWMLFGEIAFVEPGEIIEVAGALTGLSIGRLQNIRSICRRVPPDRRRVDLPFEHHKEVAPLDPEGQSEWLQRAVDNRWTKEELGRSLRHGGRPLSQLPQQRRIAEAARRVCAAAEPRRRAYVVPHRDLETLAAAIGALLPELEDDLLDQVRRRLAPAFKTTTRKEGLDGPSYRHA